MYILFFYMPLTIKQTAALIIFILLFLYPFFTFYNIDGEVVNQTHPDPIVSTPSRSGPQLIGEFADGRSFIEMEFSEIGGDGRYYNSTAYVRIPKNAEISSASLDIEGISVPIPDNIISTINFSKTARTEAYAGIAFNDPPQGPLQDKKGYYKFNSVHRNNISSDDGLYVINTSKGIGTHAFQMFQINLSTDKFDAINFSWQGHGVHTGAPPVYGAKIFYWTGSNFALLGIASGGGGSDYDFSVVLDEPDMLDSTGNLHALVISPYQSDSNLSELHSDFVEVQTLKNGTGLSFPYNLSLDAGDDGQSFVNISYELRDKLTLSHGIASQLQAVVDAQGGGYGDITIPLNFSSERPGILNISALEIIYSLDINPELIKPIPNSTVLAEDSGWTQSSIMLYNFFDDKYGTEHLSFDVTYKQDESEVNCLIEHIHPLAYLYFYTSDNFFGVREFQVSATNKGEDGIPDTTDDRTTLSNIFSVTVIPTNDPPEIYQLEFGDGSKKTITSNSTALLFGSQRAQEDTPYTLTVKALDIDGDSIIYSCNLSDGLGTDDHAGFYLDGNTGVLNFSPVDADVGTIYFNITATDENATGPLWDHLNVELQVIGLNDRPQILTKGPLLAYEDRLNTLHIDAFDEDDEQLIYSSNLTDGIGTDDRDDFYIDRQTGEISFTPSQKDVGVLSVNITVADTGGESDFRHIEIHVINVNDAPELLTIGRMAVLDNENMLFEVDEARWLNLSVNYTDEDNDVVNFRAIPLSPSKELPENFTVDPKTGALTFFAPEVLLENHRTYYIELIVDDGNSNDNKDSAFLEFQVINTNDAPIIHNLDYKIDKGTVSFVLNASDPNNDDFKVIWNFGDGSPPIVTYGFTTSRSYPGPGEYTVSVTVIDKHNASDEIILDLNLTDNDFPDKSDVTPEGGGDESTLWLLLGIIALIINILILILIIFFIVTRRKRALARRQRRMAELLLSSSGEGEVRRDLLKSDFVPGQSRESQEIKKGPMQTKLSRFGEIFSGKKDRGD